MYRRTCVRIGGVDVCVDRVVFALVMRASMSYLLPYVRCCRVFSRVVKPAYLFLIEVTNVELVRVTNVVQVEFPRTVQHTLESDFVTEGIGTQV